MGNLILVYALAAVSIIAHIAGDETASAVFASAAAIIAAMPDERRSTPPQEPEG